MNKESVSQICANMRCLRQAADRLNILYKQIDDYGNYLILNFPDILNKKTNTNSKKADYFVKPLHFIYWSTPFNNPAVSKMLKDKDFSFKFLDGQLSIPKTKAYLNPKCSRKNKIFRKYETIKNIMDDSKNIFEYPLIVKMNSGSLGKNVYKCNNRKEKEKALNKIFNKRSKNYDHIALIQEYIEIEKEYRVIRFREENLLIYEKVCKEKTKNLSPLHNPGAAIRVVDLKSTEAIDIKKFLEQSNNLRQLEFVGIDLVKDKNGEFKLIELNARPGFDQIVKHAGDKVVIEMYCDILRKL